MPIQTLITHLFQLLRTDDSLDRESKTFLESAARAPVDSLKPSDETALVLSTMMDRYDPVVHSFGTGWNEGFHGTIRLFALIQHDAPLEASGSEMWKEVAQKIERYLQPYNALIDKYLAVEAQNILLWQGWNALLDRVSSVAREGEYSRYPKIDLPDGFSCVPYRSSSLVRLFVDKGDKRHATWELRQDRDLLDEGAISEAVVTRAERVLVEIEKILPFAQKTYEPAASDEAGMDSVSLSAPLPSAAPLSAFSEGAASDPGSKGRGPMAFGGLDFGLLGGLTLGEDLSRLPSRLVYLPLAKQTEFAFQGAVAVQRHLAVASNPSRFRRRDPNQLLRPNLRRNALRAHAAVLRRRQSAAASFARQTRLWGAMTNAYRPTMRVNVLGLRR